MRVLLFIIILLGSLITMSFGDCRVLADCDNGQAQWQDLVQGVTGRPGKQGMRGPIGQKGEPGVGVNITELKDYLGETDIGPKLYYYVSTLTWHTSKAFCWRLGRTLCTHDQICLPKNGGMELIDDVVTGDHWVAVLDNTNEWTEIGDYHVTPCIFHKPLPSWGLTTAAKAYKGYVYCCIPQPSRENEVPDIRYQYIGKTATYRRSLAHCEKQGRRLCYSSEVCKLSKPVLGMAKGDKWIAVRDRFNEWIQTGDALGRTCKSHGVLLGLPTWGTREDGSTRDDVGYVYCCKNGADT